MWSVLLAALVLQASPRVPAQERSQRRCVGKCRTPGVMPPRMRATMRKKVAQWSQIDSVEPNAGIMGPQRCEFAEKQGRAMAGEYECSGVDLLSMVPRTKAALGSSAVASELAPDAPPMWAQMPRHM